MSTRIWAPILVVAGLSLVIVGCGGKGTRVPPSGADYQGNYYGRYMGAATGALILQVQSNGGFSAVYVGPEGCGIARGGVETSGQLVVTDVQPEGVEFAGHITAFGGGGSITLLNGKIGTWTLARSGSREAKEDEFWAGNMFGDSEGMVVGRATVNDTVSFILAGTEMLGQVEGAVDIDGHVVAATTDYGAGMEATIQGQSMTGVWYHVEDKLAGTLTLARAPKPFEIEVAEGEDPPEDKIWLGETTGNGLTVCVSMQMTGGGGARGFVVNPEGGVGGGGNAVGDGRYAVVSYDNDAGLWGTAFNSTGEGSYSDKLNDRSGTYTFTEYEGELSGLRGSWSGSLDYDDGGDSGTLDFIVNGANIAWARITPPTGEGEEPEYFFMNGIIAEDGSFEATSDNGEFVFTGDFGGARAEGDWTRTVDDEVTSGTWKITYSG
jgi:hypothetical protein